MSNKILLILLTGLSFSVFLFQNCAGPTTNFIDKTSSSETSNQEELNSSSLDDEINNQTNNSQSYSQFPNGNASSFFSPPKSSNTSNQNSQNITPTPAPVTNLDTSSIAPGSACSYVKSLAGLGYNQLLSDFKAAFDGSYLKVGESMPWASGTITRNKDGDLDFKNPNDPADNFTMKKTDSPKRIALDHFTVHRLWMKQYGVQFGQSKLQILGAANSLRHLFGYPMGPNKSFPLGFLNLVVSTDNIAGNYTFQTPDGPMNTVQFLSSNWCLAMTSDWGQCEQ